MPSIAIVWFRRDLRVTDNPALAAAVAEADIVVPVFVFDEALLHGRWPAPNRVWFMRESVGELCDRPRAARRRPPRPGAAAPRTCCRRWSVRPARPRCTSPETPRRTGARRDRDVADALAPLGVTVHAKRGLYVHEPDEVLTADGRPFSVFGAFRRAWEARPRRSVLPAPDRIPGLPGRTSPDPIPEVALPTADHTLLPTPGETAARARLDRWLSGRALATYAEDRNRLDLDGTSRLSADLRFGLLSPLEVVERAEGPGDGRRVFTSEVVWREFYAHVLWHNPRVTTRAVPACLRRPAVARRPGGLRRLGARAAPATRSSTPRCASSARAASSTTGRG